MATLHTPVRQPFGVLDSSKIRNLQSIKNRQNAILSSSAPSLKRSHVSLDLSDSENVDPIQYQASKRKRVDGENDVVKPPKHALKLTPKSILKPRSRISHSSAPTSLPQTPRVDTTRLPTAVSSAPAPAGRSPVKSKRSGILSNHRTRLNAPSLGGSSRAPLSLAAALQGTLAGKKQRKRASSGSLEDAKPKSWFFDIFEETPEQEKTSLELWGTIGKAGNLDISDDESSPKKAKAEEYTEEEKNKENIAPDATFPYNSSTPAISRKDMMTDETRSPLGNLKASDYYGEGCDATSVALVHDEDETDHEDSYQPEAPSSTFDFQAVAPLPVTHAESTLSQSELDKFLVQVSPMHSKTAESRLDPEAGLFKDQADGIETGEGAVEPAEIEIWESESAKGENDAADEGTGICTEL